MNDTIRNDILKVIGEGELITKEKRVNTDRLQELSNKTIHNASIFQDNGSVKVAIIFYALSKLIGRGVSGQQFSSELRKIQKALEERNFRAFHQLTNKLLQHISSIDSKMKLYVDEVIKQAQIKKGYKVFDHGISISQASEILGVSQWELTNYIGKTIVHEPEKERYTALQRLDYVRKLFSIKQES